MRKLQRFWLNGVPTIERTHIHTHTYCQTESWYFFFVVINNLTITDSIIMTDTRYWHSIQSKLKKYGLIQMQFLFCLNALNNFITPYQRHSHSTWRFKFLFLIVYLRQSIIIISRGFIMTSLQEFVHNFSKNMFKNQLILSWNVI